MNTGSSFKIQSNGWGHCFHGSCEGPRNYSPEQLEKLELTNNNNVKEMMAKVEAKRELTPLVDFSLPLFDRGLTKETTARYRVNVGDKDKGYVSKSPLFDRESCVHVGNKVRSPEKGFYHEGSAKNLMLFGQHAFPEGSAKAITVTEGYEDAMAVYQMTGSQFPAVSVHSSSTAERDIRENFEYLNSFEKIVFAFDNDEAGRKALRDVSNIGFPIGKVRTLLLRKYKDANDYLVNKETEAFSKEWWQAPVHKPDGLKIGKDIWKEIIERKESFTVQYPFPGLNKKTYGLRLSELVVITADTGVGKTSLLKHIEHELLVNEDVKAKNYGVGFLHFEEPNGDTALGLLSVHNGVPYHLPDSARPEADLRRAYDELLNNDRVVIWDHFGSNSVDAVLDKVRHMAALGCKYIVIDHLSIIVSDQSGDERKQLDEITTKLKTLTMELDLSVVAVIHTNRQGQIRGTAGVEQLANIVIRAERDKTDSDEFRRNVTKLTVEKNRFCGYTGPACYLWYNPETGRLSELTEEEVKAFENKEKVKEDWSWTKD